jgi:hypothetical protein
MGDSSQNADPLVRDRIAIQELKARYARGIDAKDYDQVKSCFWPDAFCDYGAFLVQAEPEQTFAVIAQALTRYTVTMHFLGTQSIRVEGDHAHMETYAVAYHNLPGAPPELMISGVCYVDDLERRSVEWRIQRRRLDYLWQSRMDSLPVPGSPGYLAART